MRVSVMCLLVFLQGCVGVHYGYVAGSMLADGFEPPILFRTAWAHQTHPMYGLTDFQVQFFGNREDKPIKYVDMVVVPYNKVHDPVGTVRAFRATGPYGEGSFEMGDVKAAWVDPSIAYACIDSFRLTYMDGTEEIFLEEEAEAMMFPGLKKQCENRQGGYVFTSPQIENAVSTLNAAAAI